MVRKEVIGVAASHPGLALALLRLRKKPVISLKDHVLSLPKNKKITQTRRIDLKEVLLSGENNDADRVLYRRMQPLILHKFLDSLPGCQLSD